MIALTMCIQLFTLIKTSIAAKYFGASIQMDSFNLANNIGSFLFSFIGAGITTVLIPNMINNRKSKSINIFISFIYSISFVILLFIYFNRKVLISIFPNQNIEFIQITCNLLFISLISQFVNSLLGVTNAIFQCNGKFNIAKFITLFTSMLLAIVLILDSNMNIYKYNIYIAIITILNVFLQILLAYKEGFKYKFILEVKDKQFKKMMYLFLPTVLSTGLYQVSLMTDTIISSGLGTGQISLLSYSNTIVSMINSLLLSNIMIFLYPKIVMDIKKSTNHKKIFDLFTLINGIMLLLLIGFIIVGKEGIELLFQRGQFTSEITNSVYICATIYIFGLPATALRDLLYRYFYAKEDTKTPFKNSLLISLLNIIISIMLSKYIGIYGIILGTVITSYMSLIMIFIRFYRKFGIKYKKSDLISENIKLLIISLLTVIISFYIKSIMSGFHALIILVVVSIMIILIFSSMLILFKSNILKISL